MKRGKASDLPKGSHDRMIARIAARANCDTIWGGFRAAQLAERAERMGLPSAGELLDAVSATYGLSAGHVPNHLAVCQCFECGQWYLGDEAAANCCAPDDDCTGDQ